MFRDQPSETGPTYRLAIAGLLALSLAAMVVTLWIMRDYLREQEVVSQLMKQLPPSAASSAEQLVGELRWQFRLTMLVVLNLVVTGLAIILLWRAYGASQKSLRELKALAGDVLSSMDLAVITADVEGRVTSINRRAIELFELSEDQVGRPLRLLSADVPLERFRRDARDNPAKQCQDFTMSHNGSTRTLRAFCHPLRNQADVNIGNVIQIRDVTERVLMDDRMRRMERYMGLGSLAAGLHHEIKNPLSGFIAARAIDGRRT